MNLKAKILEFLYQQVEENKIPQIRKGMVEDLEKFVTSILADQESQKSADRMKAASEEPEDEVPPTLSELAESIGAPKETQELCEAADRLGDVNE